MEYPAAVSTFAEICLTGDLDPNARVLALETGDWTEDPGVSIDIAKLEISRAIDKNYRFSRLDSARQWSGSIDGQPARLVLAKFSEKDRYPNLCALVMEGAKNAMPYGDAVRSAFREFGIKGKSVDLVHYYEFAGKVGAEKHPVRGEIFTRSQAGSSKETMHIYVAY